MSKQRGVSRRRFLGTVAAGFGAPHVISSLGAGTAALAAQSLATPQNVRIVTPSGLSSSVLSPSDFAYLGAVTVPKGGEGGTYFSFSNARLAGRVVSGQIRLFLTQANPSVGGWHDDVAELQYNGVGNPLTLVTNWGDITKG